MAPTDMTSETPELSPVSREAAAIQGLMLLWHRAEGDFRKAAKKERDLDPDETDTDDELINNDSTLYTMQFDTRVPAGTKLDPSPMLIQNIDNYGPWFYDLLLCKPLSDFIATGLRSTHLNETAIRRVAELLTTMTKRNCFQEACWYLDECDWDVANAVKLYLVDEKKRTRQTQVTAQYTRANNLAVHVTATNYTLSDLVFDFGNRTIAKFCDEVDFDEPEAPHLAALNQWRNDIVRMSKYFAEVHTVDDFPNKNMKWSSAERRFLRNRYYSSYLPQMENGGPRPSREVLTNEFNELFMGRFVPGAVSPCGQRSVNSIVGLLRQMKGDIKKEGERTVTHQTMMRRLLEQRRVEQVEFDALVNDGGDVGAPDGGDDGFEEGLFIKKTDHHDGSNDADVE